MKWRGVYPLRAGSCRYSSTRIVRDPHGREWQELGWYGMATEGSVIIVTINFLQLHPKKN